jgi:glycosyltransferase involved in cell wall biosynthesis
VEGDNQKRVIAAPPVKDDGRIRVLFVMLQMAMGGSERVVYDLVRSLDRGRFAPSVAWLAQPAPLREFVDLEIPLHYVPKRGRFDIHAMAALGRIIRDGRIDVVNAHHFMPFVYAYPGARLMNRRGLVYTEHSAADVGAARGKWRRLGGYLLRRSHAVGISEEVSRTIREHFGVPASVVHTIENGVDAELFAAAATEREARRQALGFGAGEVVFGHVANFRRNKNHLFLLRAFAEVVRVRPQARLVLLGQGFADDTENSQPEVARFIAEHDLSGRVEMAGYRSDVHHLLGALDGFCLVSYKEGLPLSLVEAMATALPAIGTDIEGIRTVVERNVTGLLVPPDDVPALVGALLRVIDDKDFRRSAGQAAQQLARRRYSLQRSLDQLQDLFISVAGASAPQARPRTSPAL